MSNFTSQLQQILTHYNNTNNNHFLEKELRHLLAAIQDGNVPEVNPERLGDAVHDYLKTTFNNPQLLLPTGFTTFDSVFGGLCKGEFTVVGARPGMGKTQWLVNMSYNMASQNIPCGFICLDLSRELLINRYISHLTKIPQQDLLKGKHSSERLVAIADAAGALGEAPLYIADQFISNIESLSATCTKLVNHKVQVIFIDYLQLITGSSRRQNRDAELAQVSRTLKLLAKQHNVSIVASSQLSRQVENRPGGSKRPQLSDLRESGAIEQDADKVLFLYRPEYYGLEVDENNEPTRYLMEIIMAKNKSGTCETIKMKTESHFTGFLDYSFGFNISDQRLNDLF